MKALTGLGLLLCLTATVAAQGIDFEPPTYAPGALVGQDGWTCCAAGSDSSGFTVDNTVYSPMGGSTQSMKTIGVSSGNRVWKALASNISSGVYRLGWDIRHTGSGSPFATVIFYTPGRANQMLQAYLSGNNLGTWYNNGGLTSTDYGNRDIFGGVAPADKWVRYEFVLDLDRHMLLDLNAYDISTGAKVLLAHSDGYWFTRSDGTNWVGPFAQWGLRLDSIDSSNAVWLDNITVDPVTFPAPVIAEVPNPDSMLTGFFGLNEYCRRMMCTTAAFPIWSLLSGPTGATINATTGIISGWKPAVGAPAATFTVQASNSSGTDTKTFTVNTARYGTWINLPLDSQITTPAGDMMATYPGSTLSWPTDETPSYTRTSLPGGDVDWQYWTPAVRFWYLGRLVDVSECQTIVQADLRYYQDPSDGTPYRDAPIGIKLHSYAPDGTETGDANLDWVYVVQNGDPPYPTWTTKSVSASHIVGIYNNFDPHRVGMVEFYVTDWDGTGKDWVDVKNLVIKNDMPGAPAIAAISSPQVAFAAIPYQQQVSTSPCEAVTWTLAGPPGSAIDANGLVTWTPGAGDAGLTRTFTATATNTAGSGSASWQVQVFATPATDNSVASPWGTRKADIFGRNSSSNSKMVLDNRWATDGADVDWTLDTASLGLRRPSDFSGMAFDEDGNIYWKTRGPSPASCCEGDPDNSATGTYVASVSPTGALRWTGNSLGTPVALGADDYTTPVVGDGGPDGRVYVVVDSRYGGIDGIAAFSKTDGQLVWQTALPDCWYRDPWSDGNPSRFTPVLYGGKLYALSTEMYWEDACDWKIYQVDALTGHLDWHSTFCMDVSRSYWGWVNPKGHMTLVPDAFGTGLHGLYVNCDSNGDLAHKDMFALKIDSGAGSASLAWSDYGDKSGHSQPIYVPDVNRICTLGWDDYGTGLVCWNLDGSGRSAVGNPAGIAKSGWQDVSALDPANGNQILAGSFNGNLLRYWNLTAMPAAEAAGNLVYDTAGFEGYANGTIIGQDGWADDSWGGFSSPTIVDDPTGTGHGKVLKLAPDADNNANGTGCVRVFGSATTQRLVTLEFDEYRGSDAQDMWLADKKDYSGWWAAAFANNGNLSAANIWNGRAAAPITTGVWQHVKYQFNYAAGFVIVSVDGNVAVAMPNDGDLSIEGWDFEIIPQGATDPTYIDNLVVKQGDPANPEDSGYYQVNITEEFPRSGGCIVPNQDGKSIVLFSGGTNPTSGNKQIIAFNATDAALYNDPATHPTEASWFEFDSGTTAVWGGPQMGPTTGTNRQHVYYFRDNNTLVALTYVRLVPGDCSTDGVTLGHDKSVNGQDLLFFESCSSLAGPGIPVSGDCACDDLDKDGDVDQDDFGLFLRCYLLTAPVSPDCAN